FEEASRDVERDRDFGIVLQDFEKGSVAVLIGGFEHSVEVADRLMVVDRQNESKLTGHGQNPFVPFSTPRILRGTLALQGGEDRLRFSRKRRWAVGYEGEYANSIEDAK